MLLELPADYMVTTLGQKVNEAAALAVDTASAQQCNPSLLDKAHEVEKHRHKKLSACQTMHSAVFS